MKKLRIDIVLINFFLFLLILQGSELIYLKNYEIPAVNDATEIHIKNLDEILKKVEDENCTVLQMKYESGWKGNLLFAGDLENLAKYVGLLKDNNIYVKNYKIEKVGELKCFMEIKAV
ncbi:hypothetical protein GNF80_01285 [Clostridium perfringens]|nr:hypothetical protein [Clostridium perfringens]